MKDIQKYPEAVDDEDKPCKKVEGTQGWIKNKVTGSQIGVIYSEEAGVFVTPYDYNRIQGGILRKKAA